MGRITLQRAARSFRRIKLLARVAIIDDQHKSARELPRHAFHPFQGPEIDLCLVRGRQIWRNLCELPAQFLILDWFGEESKSVVRLPHESIIPLGISLP